MSIALDISTNVHYSRHMEINDAVILFDALSQETRLRAIRLLIKAGPDGLPAGSLSETLDIPHNTLSFHLTHLSHAGIVSSRKEGRSVIYMANYQTMINLIAFMIKDCCNQGMANIKEDKQKGCSIIELMNCCK